MRRMVLPFRVPDHLYGWLYVVFYQSAKYWIFMVATAIVNKCFREVFDYKWGRWTCNPHLGPQKRFSSMQYTHQERWCTRRNCLLAMMKCCLFGTHLLSQLVLHNTTRLLKVLETAGNMTVTVCFQIISIWTSIDNRSHAYTSAALEILL